MDFVVSARVNSLRISIEAGSGPCYGGRGWDGPGQTGLAVAASWFRWWPRAWRMRGVARPPRRLWRAR